MKARTFAAATVAVMAVAACAQPGPARRAQCAERARALVMKMTPEERLTQIFMSSREIPRLGIRHREWWNEALHGVARTGLATVFPQSIGAGATFDTDLEYRMARIISEEGRAKSFGEDPYLTSRLGVAFVKGLQGDNPDFLQAAGCAKHFAVHSGPENLRHGFDAVVSPRDLAEYYLVAFRALAMEGKVEAFMGAYSRLNGVPCCANKWLLTDLLRGEWGFAGHIVSDVGAVDDIFSGHHYAATYAEATAKTLPAGLDLQSEWNFTGISAANEQGLLDEKDVIEHLVRLYTTRFLLGEFDKTPWDDYGAERIATPEHRAVALEMAEKSLVLVHNNGVLPLDPDAGAISVVGPLAASELPMRGNYNGQAAAPVSVIAAVTAEAGPAVRVVDEWDDGDTAIVCLGITSEEEGEEGCGSDNQSGDRSRYSITDSQLAILRKCRRKNARVKRVVSIVFGGSPFDLRPIVELSDAVIVAWYPGEAGGTAIARTIFGKSNPSGCLPVTFPKSYDDLPAFTDYSLAGRTYRYATKAPEYPFGHGLSCVEVAFHAELLAEADCLARRAEELAPETAGDRRRHHLEGFSRVRLDPGASGEVAFRLSRSQFEVFREDGSTFVPQGATTVFVGGGQPGFAKNVKSADVVF